MRASIGLVVIGVALAGSLGSAAAQYYPPQPVYRDANGVPIDSRYVQPAPGEETYSDQSARQPYFAPQPLPGRDERPPVEVAGSSPNATDVTGSINSPRQAAVPQSPSQTMVASLPNQSQPDQDQAMASRFHRQVVNFPTDEPAGTVIIDTPNTYLYLTLGHGKAMRYGIGVGREGFTWSGSERISRMKEWPDWFPPREMIERQPYLPRFMAGGETNPLGARAMYLGNTLYRIHGTNDPSTIGKYISSGCIRLTNEDVEDLYSRVNIGTRVVVLPATMPDTASPDVPQAPQYSSGPRYSAAPPIPPGSVTR